MRHSKIDISENLYDRQSAFIRHNLVGLYRRRWWETLNDITTIIVSTHAHTVRHFSGLIGISLTELYCSMQEWYVFSNNLWFPRWSEEKAADIDMENTDIKADGEVDRGMGISRSTFKLPRLSWPGTGWKGDYTAPRKFSNGLLIHFERMTLRTLLQTKLGVSRVHDSTYLVYDTYRSLMFKGMKDYWEAT